MSSDEPELTVGKADTAELETEVRRLRAEVAALRQALAARDDPAFDASARATALETALLALPVGVAFFDADDRLVIKNNRYQLYDATGERDRPGTRFEDFLRFGIELGLYAEAQEDPEGWMRDRLRLRREPGPASIQKINDGRFIQIEERRLDDGRLISAFTDVTQLKNTEAALYRALERSEAAGRAKTQFLAKMSHELRMPLNAIIGFSQMMMADEELRISEERRRGYLADIQFAAGHLHDLISDILELARIESGQEKIERQPVDVVDLCERVSRMFAGEAQKNGVRLSFEVTEGAPASNDLRMLDDQLVTQMLINLLTNSMRFVPEAGLIRLGLVLGDDETRLSVSDNGAGISDEDLEIILEPFQQGESKPLRGRGGVGLGLSITKGMVELHDGTIAIRSVLGEGTEVTLCLPTVVPDEDASSE
jgi:signal transduction histidine kinase